MDKCLKETRRGGQFTLNTTHDDDFHQPNFPGTSIQKGGPREPWQDIHCRTEGPAAWDVLYNFEQRWRKQDDQDTWNVQAFRSIDGGCSRRASEVWYYKW
ncbi:hypothetical protein KY285_000826 [Solanum tuberosum]|nr:hypothetical protein KY289_001013 [Solanum tuberosum]KAH0764955.1 hypothetical protein KY285_000826 [Solanum tuberosum]